MRKVPLSLVGDELQPVAEASGLLHFQRRQDSLGLEASVLQELRQGPHYLGQPIVGGQLKDGGPVRFCKVQQVCFLHGQLAIRLENSADRLTILGPLALGCHESSSQEHLRTFGHVVGRPSAPLLLGLALAHAEANSLSTKEGLERRAGPRCDQELFGQVVSQRQQPSCSLEHLEIASLPRSVLQHKRIPIWGACLQLLESSSYEGLEEGLPAFCTPKPKQHLRRPTQRN
mmetsp:Transcript_70826/g.153820  ORF Transcript_70826/g.153820 Transcript_70826/m.153820 type:complete len:230 (-) Transcript_70826:514-1203(-)